MINSKAVRKGEESQKQIVSLKDTLQITELNQPIQLMILNINVLNIVIKKQRWSDWIKKTQLFCGIKSKHFTYKDRSRLNVKGWNYTLGKH